MTKRLLLPLFSDTGKLPQGAGLPAPLGRMAERAIAEKLFKGEAGEAVALVPPQAGDGEVVVLLGLGAEPKLTLDALRKCFGVYARRARKEGVGAARVDLAAPRLRGACGKLGWKEVARAVSGAWALGGYAFEAYKTGIKEKRKPAALVASWSGLAAADRAAALEGWEEGEILAAAANRVRQLANLPANDLSPLQLAAEGRRMAREAGLRFRLLTRAALEKEKMGALLGVAQGSDRPPCLMVVEYRPRGRVARVKGKPLTLALVGKAITFDCGGLSIKPAKGMEEMKFDMSGGAAVLGALTAIARLGLPIHVVGIVPASDNAIGGSAMRPGDILRAASGKTIEVLNTDAEGRLILADALHYARRFQPNYIIDFATLTGACLVALGTQISGLMTNDKALGRLVFEAGERSGDRVWELPLYEEFIEATKSTVADIKNSTGRNGGAITAAGFLHHFVEKTPWCHVDIAGTAWAERDAGPYATGATGVGVRLACEVAAALARGASD